MRRIVILGGGYSSIWCYRAVRRWMGASARITVVAPFADQVFHGFTGEVLDGEIPAGLQVSPLEQCVPKAERVRGWATAVDPDRRTVQVEWQGATTEVEYDELVVATGAHDRMEHVPGLAEHGWALRFPGRVGALLDHLAVTDQQPVDGADEIARRDTVVVIGAGFAGTESAAALGRRYGSAKRIVLVSSTETVVPVWQDRLLLQQRLLANLEAAGVELRLGTRVAEVDARGVVLGDGSRIEAATVVATLGNHVPVLPGLERFQEADGLLQVDDCLRVTDGVWSAGDVAAVRVGGSRAPKEALWAIRAGTTVGRNIARTARRARPRRFAFKGLGTVASFAPGRAVLTMFGIPFPQTLGWVVRQAFFLWYVPSRRTALNILRWSVRPGHREVTLSTGPIPVPGAGRPALVGLAGGLTPAKRLRAAVRAEPSKRAQGA